MLRRRGLILLGSLAASHPHLAAADAGAEMVMFERHDCAWCRRWLREVTETAWNGSDLGRRAPLRRVDVGQGLPPDLRFISNWRFTPTFVLVSGGREIGRIVGYQGDLFFWPQAEALVARLPAAASGNRS